MKYDKCDKYEQELKQIWKPQWNKRLANPHAAYSMRTYSSSPEMWTLVEHLFNEINLRKECPTPKAEGKMRKALNNILANFVFARAKANEAGDIMAIVRIKMDNNAFATKYKRGLDHYQHRIVRPVVLSLEKHGYIGREKGYPDLNGGQGHATKIYTLKPILDLFDSYNINSSMVEILPWGETIHMHKKVGGGNGNDYSIRVEYTDNAYTKTLRDFMTLLNGHIGKSTVTLKIEGDTPEDTAKLLQSLKRKSRRMLAEYFRYGKLEIINGVCIDLQGNVSLLLGNTYLLEGNGDVPCISTIPNTNTLSNNCIPNLVYNRTEYFQSIQTKIEGRLKGESLHRVFNNGSWDLGGRFYGPHIGLTEELRSYLHIDGKPVTELDFSAMYIRMLYHLKGIECPYDLPYEGIPIDGITLPRKFWKEATNISLNTKTELAAKRAIVKRIREIIKEDEFSVKPLSFSQVQQMLDHIKKRHTSIIDHFFKEEGLELQRTESKIMRRIMDAMMFQLTEPALVLPVHDSCIVQKEYGDVLKQVMVEKYQEVLGTKFEPVIK